MNRVASGAIITKSVSRGWLSVGSVMTRNIITGTLISANGTPEQKQRFLPKIARGEILTAAAFTEPDSGSDTASFKTRAVKHGDGYLLNTASAPFDGAPFPATRAPGVADLEGMLPFPQVMRFRVVPGPAARRRVPTAIATDYRPPSQDELADAPRRAIALVEREMEGETNMLSKPVMLNA